MRYEKPRFGGVFIPCRMSAMGRKWPFEPILAERPLAGVKRTFQIGQFLKMLGYSGNVRFSQKQTLRLPKYLRNDEQPIAVRQ